MGSPEEIDLGDIGVTNPGTRLFLKTDRPILVALNDNTFLWETKGLVMSGTEITNLYVQNTDATKEATIEFLVTAE